MASSYNGLCYRAWMGLSIVTDTVSGQFKTRFCLISGEINGSVHVFGSRSRQPEQWRRCFWPEVLVEEPMSLNMILIPLKPVHISALVQEPGSYNPLLLLRLVESCNSGRLGKYVETDIIIINTIIPNTLSSGHCTWIQTFEYAQLCAVVSDGSFAVMILRGSSAAQTCWLAYKWASATAVYNTLKFYHSQTYVAKKPQLSRSLLAMDDS